MHRMNPNTSNPNSQGIVGPEIGEHRPAIGTVIVIVVLTAAIGVTVVLKGEPSKVT
jgi:hypothetical protein